MHSNRWTTVAESSFPWEREALGFLREHLPDREPWRAWSNFEFVDDQGRVRRSYDSRQHYSAVTIPLGGAEWDAC